jgi:2-iminoacetate synthase
MFSETLSRVVTLAAQVGAAAPLGSSAFLALLEKAARESLSDDEIVALVDGTRDEANGRLLVDFAAGYRRPHDREVLLLPPLYFSSICENRCAYCSFSDDGCRLTLPEFEREVRFLVELGFRSLELVSSQDPELYVHADDFVAERQRFAIDPVIPYIQTVTRMLAEAGGGMLTTNIPPLDVESMRRLREQGLDCFLVWQETFNPEQYKRLHIAHGPKGNHAFRIDSMENAIAAGIPHLAGAFLKGLYDWRKEEVVLYLFDRHLKQQRGRGLSIIGTPRVKGPFANAAVIRQYAVSDREYELNIALDRVLFDGILWLQTRESFETNLELMKRFGAGVILTILSSTAPGGYAAPAQARPQFPVFKQELDASVAALERAGLTARLAWDAQTLTTFVRGSAA